MNEVHLFGSGLWADRLSWSPSEIKKKITDVSETSAFTFKIVFDLEEVLGAYSHTVLETHKAEARAKVKDLFTVLTDTDFCELYQWLIVRINTYGSDEYMKDLHLFQELRKSHDIESLAGVYLPDVESADILWKTANDIHISPHKVMPIIESSSWHDVYDSILEKMLHLSPGKDIYVIGTWDAYHRFLNRAEESSFLPAEYICLPPDTSLAHTNASGLAHIETVQQLQKTNRKNKWWKINLILATSTYIWKWCWDITQHKIDTYSKEWVCYLQPDQKRYMDNRIWSVCIDPKQLKVSSIYSKHKIHPDIPLDHNHSSHDIVKQYIYAKKHNEKPILDDYIILDVTFYIALFKQFKKHGIKKCVKKYPWLHKYMWTDSALLREAVFQKHYNDIRIH